MDIGQLLQDDPWLYHGSPRAGITTLKPFPHPDVDGQPVIFITPDLRFALAMIHGKRKELKVSYHADTKTKQPIMYIDELEEAGLQFLNQPGTLYLLEHHHLFESHPGLLAVERICRQEITVYQEIFIPSVSQVLVELGVFLVPFPTVASSLAQRDPQINQSAIKTKF